MGEASILSAAGQVAEYRADAGFVGLQPSMFLFLSEPHRQQSRLHQQIPSQEPHRHQVPSRSQEGGVQRSSNGTNNVLCGVA
ncbi:hypothetical protein SETIT_5G251800v2 [Setaria italica]|uniref:Uncharacterized protein n=1 Tax=Setaria italica TaxID=4555 RepID=A0A368R8J3_SETIT|nr:hypothetical protein SETIT_5G251800v2 [Setaria italica]